MCNKNPTQYNSKRRQEYKYTVEQSSEFNSLMVRQHVGGGKRVYDPKTESSIWEPYTKNDTKEMEEIIVNILDAKKPTPVIVAMEQDLSDQVDPNTYHLLLAFPPSSDDGGGVATPVAPNFYPRRVRVPLVIFTEMLARAFEGQMTSTALCFVADASSGLGSETLTTIAKRCNHGVVSAFGLLYNAYFILYWCVW